MNRPQHVAPLTVIPAFEIGTVFVRSQSEPVWHRVTKDGCDCKATHFNPAVVCAHMKAAAEWARSPEAVAYFKRHLPPREKPKWHPSKGRHLKSVD